MLSAIDFSGYKHYQQPLMYQIKKSDRKCYALAKLYEDLVGMANTDGRCLYLGVEDNGTPIQILDFLLGTTFPKVCDLMTLLRFISNFKAVN